MDGTLLGKKYNLMNGGGSGGGGTAAETTYDNTTSGLEAENVQSAIDEVVSDLGTLDETVNGIAEEIGDSDSGLVKAVDDLETAVSGLSDDIGALEDANKYLTAETLVGKWGNANLYRKYVSVNSLPNNSSVDVTLGINGYTLRRLEAYYNSDAEAGMLLAYLSDMYYTTSTDKLTIQTATDMSSYSGTIIVEYTK